jgi:arginase family enzyme
VDAIDPTIIPAVNFPSQEGLTLEDIHEVVRTLAGTGKLKVFNLVGYNASLDKDGASRKIILDLIAGLSFQ